MRLGPPTQTRFAIKSCAAILEPDLKVREAALRTLAADPKAAELSPASAVLLASALRSLKAPEPAVGLLRAVVGRHPDDVWANYELATALTELRPSARDEAVRFGTAARSLRPETVHALAHLLAQMGAVPRHWRFSPIWPPAGPTTSATWPVTVTASRSVAAPKRLQFSSEPSRSHGRPHNSDLTKPNRTGISVRRSLVGASSTKRSPNTAQRSG